MPSAYERMLKAAAEATERGKIAPPPKEKKKKKKKPKKDKKAIKKVMKKAKVKEKPPRDERTLAEVPDEEALEMQSVAEKMTVEKLEAFLASKDKIPWQEEIALAELEKRKAPPGEEVPAVEVGEKSVEEILLETGEVPHFLIEKKSEWAEMSEEEILADVKDIDERIIIKLSEYYNRLEELGDLNENEKIAAEALRDRIWNEEIGEVSVDLVPLLPEDMEKLEEAEVELRTGEKVNVFDATNRQLAEGIYIAEGGPLTWGEFKGSPFDKAVPIEERSEFIDDITVRFDPVAYALDRPDAPLRKVESSLNKKALFKRLLFGVSAVPIAVVKGRQGRAEEVEAVMRAYYPPEYEELKEYYQPEWGEMDLSEAQKEMIKLKPKDLHETFKLYYILKAKESLNPKEEYLLDEMTRILGQFHELGIIKEIEYPELRPPKEAVVAAPTPPEAIFDDYLEVVNTLFAELPEKTVKDFARKAEAELVVHVLETGEATEAERARFVVVVDKLFENLPVGVRDAFVESAAADIYSQVAEEYMEG